MSGIRKALTVLLLLSGGLRASGAAERATNYEEALDRAAKTGKDIAVFQRGSDWNRLGERLFREVWDQEDFAGLAGDDLVLVCVDRPEEMGADPVSGIARPDTLPGAAAPESPARRLRRFVGEEQTISRSGLTSVMSEGGATLTQQADGSFLASGSNPSQDMLTLAVDTAGGGSLLRLDFLRHASLPGGGPGRASNGNFAISEIEVTDAGGEPVGVEAAWASAVEGGWGAWQAIDGVRDQAGNLWNPAGHLHETRTLLLALGRTTASNGTIRVKLVCRSGSAQHVPGCLRAAVLSDGAVEADVRRVGGAELTAARNAKFVWRGCNVPRVALMDSRGRPVASEDRPRLGLTPAALADALRGMRAARARRDELWDRAAQTNGAAAAILYMQGFRTMTNALTFDPAYKTVQQSLRQADPGDESGCLRWLQFQPDPRSTPPPVAAALKLAGEQKFEEALAALDTELRHPGNRWLSNEQLQRIMIGKFHVYRRWPGNEEHRFEIQREIYALDPTTFWGLGAIGYLAMNYRTEKPVALCYGWASNQVVEGSQVWDLNLDTALQFDHAGRYKLRIVHNGGKDALRIQGVELRDGAEVLSRAAVDADLSPGGQVEALLEIGQWPPRSKLTLRVELAGKPGQLDAAGRFEVEPEL